MSKSNSTGKALPIQAKKTKPYRLTFELFIQRAKAIHGDKYVYLSSRYTGTQNKVGVECGEAGFIYDLENKIHQLLSKYRYKPIKRFAGHTECFSKIPKDVEKLLKTLENSQQIQLIA